MPTSLARRPGEGEARAARECAAECCDAAVCALCFADARQGDSHSCITQLKAQGPSRTCNESKEEEEEVEVSIGSWNDVRRNATDQTFGALDRSLGPVIDVAN